MSLLEFIDKIKNHFSVSSIQDDPKYKTFVDEVIPSLKFGDIVYAERFDNDIQKKQMGEGHNTGPFIVLSIDGDRIVGAFCTSNPNYKGAFQVGEYYNLFFRRKNSYATLLNSKTIDAEAFFHKHDNSLREFDKKRIMKKLCLTNSDYFYNDFCLVKKLKVDFDVEFEIGDVVYYNNYSHIIIGRETDQYVIIPIHNYDPRYSFVDSSVQKIDYSNAIVVDKNSLVYLNSMLESQLSVVLKNYKEHLKKKNDECKKEIKTIDRGYLLNTTDGLYYVFGVTGNMANSFAVKRVNVMDGAISIAGKKYMPSYENTRDFDMKIKNYAILSIASDEEMNQIKEAKKSYKRSIHLDSKPNQNISGYTFVCLCDNETSRYMVYREHDDTYSVITLSSLLSGGELEMTQLPKSIVKSTKKITYDELRTIRSNLVKRNNDKMSRKLLQLLYNNTKYSY